MDARTYQVRDPISVHSCGPEYPDQFRIENISTLTFGNFEREAISFSGYFGLHGPHVFAAAPLLLAACQAVMPKNIGVDDRDLPDVEVVPVLMTMGELRQLHAAIAAATADPAPALASRRSAR